MLGRRGETISRGVAHLAVQPRLLPVGQHGTVDDVFHYRQRVRRTIWLGAIPRASTPNVSALFRDTHGAAPNGLAQGKLGDVSAPCFVDRRRGEHGGIGCLRCAVGEHGLVVPSAFWRSVCECRGAVALAGAG